MRRLRADGGDLDGIHCLRTFANADAIREDTEQADRVVLLGGSFIACEVAATLTSIGRRCAIVMQEEAPLERQFGGEVAGFFQRVLEEHGIEVHGSDELERYEGSDGRVGKVVTRRGLELAAARWSSARASCPTQCLAKCAGLEPGPRGGVLCSDRLETSAPGVYAAGDIAEYQSALHGGPARVEHWDVAVEHGKTAARNMLGQDRPHGALPYFWSDLADWTGLEYVGVGSGANAAPLLAWVDRNDDGAQPQPSSLADGRVLAAMTVGRSDDPEHARHDSSGARDTWTAVRWWTRAPDLADFRALRLRNAA